MRIAKQNDEISEGSRIFARADRPNEVWYYVANNGEFSRFVEEVAIFACSQFNFKLMAKSSDEIEHVGLTTPMLSQCDEVEDLHGPSTKAYTARLA